MDDAGYSRDSRCSYLLTEPKWKDVLLIDALGGELQTTPLFWASYHNHIYAVELLLAHGANAFVRDPSGYTPFLLAIQRGFPILAAYLVSKGTDINDCVAGKPLAGDVGLLHP